MTDAQTRTANAEIQRSASSHVPWPTLAVISAGGVAGALARYGLNTALPHAPGAFDWATFWINISGCLLIGALMVVIDIRQVHRLVRPFIGVGILGGYTTFSTYIVDIQKSVGAHAPRTALAYLALTIILALGAVQAGAGMTRLAVRMRRKERR